MKRISLLIMVALIFVGCSAIVSLAGVKKIYADELIPSQDSTSYSTNGIYIANISETNAANFYKRVKLPVGKTITKLAYYHSSESLTPSTAVWLSRIKMGADNEGESIASASTNTDTRGHVIEVEDSSTTNAKIKRGYSYLLHVFIRSVGSKIHGIKIYYK